MDYNCVAIQEILERVSRHCPESLSTFLQIANRADKNGNVFFSEKMVDEDLSEEWTAFRRNIKKLSLENILEWHAFNDGISVTLLTLDEDECYE